MIDAENMPPKSAADHVASEGEATAFSLEDTREWGELGRRALIGLVFGLALAASSLGIWLMFAVHK